MSTNQLRLLCARTRPMRSRRQGSPRSWLLSVALTLCSVAAATPTWAQSAASSSNSSSAQELLDRGVELRRTNQDAEALALFRQALDLEPESSRAQAHLGTTYQALGRWVLAETFLTQALAHPGDEYLERHREALQQALEFVKDHLGLLDVQGGPAGAQVLLNGQRIGSLPLAEPARVPVGAYLMEVALDGHYGLNRPVRISRRALTREDVELLPLSPAARRTGPANGAASSAAPISGEPVGRDAAGGAPSWVPWTLAGVSAGAAVVATVAWVQRQNYAERWHDDGECLSVPGATREEQCGDLRTKGERAQTVAWVSGGVALAAGTAAIWTALAGGTDSATEAGLEGCAIGSTGASCFGRF